MTERFTEEKLARIELDLSALDPDATEYHWIAAAHVRRLLKALPALVAEVRELRAEVKHIDEANTALGSQVIDLIRERDEAPEALEELVAAVAEHENATSGKLLLKAIERRNRALIRAARILKEASDGHV